MATYKNALTVDVEDYYQVSAFAKVINYADWDKHDSRVVENTRNILSLFARHSVSATFFVLGWVAERYPELVKSIDEQGHEVACHGYSHQLIYNQTPEQFQDETKKSKDLLENITGKPVRGYRAASYSITRDSLWALDVLAELGFSYDSSIFPVHHDRYGIPDAKIEPHILDTPNGSSLIEFPPSVLDVFGYRLPVSGGGYFRLFPYFLTRYALSKIQNQEKRPFIFYIHPWEIDPGQPRIRASALSRFRHYLNLDKCHDRLDRLIRDFDFTTVERVLGQAGIQEQVSAQ